MRDSRNASNLEELKSLSGSVSEQIPIHIKDKVFRAFDCFLRSVTVSFF